MKKKQEAVSKTFYFYRENNQFDDLLSESSIKKALYKMTCHQYLIVNGMFTMQELAFLTIKYGDEMKSPVVDYSPKPGIDYIPKKY